jgi:hypothetical protein
VRARAGGRCSDGSNHRIEHDGCHSVTTPFPIEHATNILARYYAHTDFTAPKSTEQHQRLILEILPCIWTFFRRGMQLRYGIDIGKAKAPLLTPDLVWSDEYLMERIRRIESFLPA